MTGSLWSVISVAAIAVGFYSVGCLSLGVIVLHLIRVDRASGAAVCTSGYLGSAFAVGQGILGVVWQSMAVMSYFSPIAVGGLLFVLLVVAIASAGGCQPMARSLWGAATDIWKEGTGWRTIAVFLIALMVAIAFLTVCPPYEDAEAFYLSLPRLIASTHRFSTLPGYEDFCQIGLGSEMHAAVYYSIVGPLWGEFTAELAAKMNVVPAIAATCLLLWALTSRVGGGRRAQVLAVAMILSSSMVWMIVFLSKSDLYPALLGVAALYWVLLIGVLEDRVALAMTGLLAGLAVSGKISYLVVMAPMLAIILTWRLWPRCMEGSATLLSTRFRLLARRYGTLSMWALLGVAPLVMKNTVVFGQPLAPLVLFGVGPTPWLQQTWFPPETTRWIVLTYPLALTYGKYPMQAGTLSVLWLAFLPMMLLSAWRKQWKQSEMLILTGSAVLGLLVWIILEPSIIAPRYYMPAVVALIPFAAIATEKAIRVRERRALRLAVIVSTIAVLGLEIRSIGPYADLGRYYVRTMPADWERQNAVWQNTVWAALNTLNRMAKPGERIYLGTYWSLQVRPDLLQCALRGHEVAVLNGTVSDPARFIGTLRAYGVRYVVQDTLTHVDFVPPWNKVRQTLSGEGISRRTFGPDERMVIYSLDGGGEVSGTSRRCLEVEPGYWRLEGGQ